MFHFFVHFSALAAGLLAEEHPPTEAINPFNFGLTPFGTVAVVLLIILVTWAAINMQAGREDLHTAVHHDDEGHDAHGH